MYEITLFVNNSLNMYFTAIHIFATVFVLHSNICRETTFIIN